MPRVRWVLDSLVNVPTQPPTSKFVIDQQKRNGNMVNAGDGTYMGGKFGMLWVGSNIIFIEIPEEVI